MVHALERELEELRRERRIARRLTLSELVAERRRLQIDCSQVRHAAAAGRLTIKKTSLVVNCPVVA